jgi:hypothetical protein
MNMEGEQVMKRTKGKGGIKRSISMCLALAFIFGLTDLASATWYFTHGNSASVQDENNPDIVSYCVRKGTGLGIILYQGDVDSSTWVHFAVPSPYGGKKGIGARYLNVRVNMVLYAGMSKITKINVYDGETLVKEFPMDYRTAGWNTINLDLGTVRKFSKGLGISVQITQDFNSGGESFEFSSAGADFVK